MSSDHIASDVSHNLTSCGFRLSERKCAKELKKELAGVANECNGEVNEKPCWNSTTISGLRSPLMEENLPAYGILFPLSTDISPPSQVRVSLQNARKKPAGSKRRPLTTPTRLGVQAPSFTGLRTSMASPSKLDFCPELNRVEKTRFPANPCNATPSKSPQHLIIPRKTQWHDEICTIPNPSASLPAVQILTIDNRADHSQYDKPSTNFQLYGKKSLERETAREMKGLSITVKNNKRNDEPVLIQQDNDSIAPPLRRKRKKRKKKRKYQTSPLIDSKIAKLEKEEEWEEKIFVSKDGEAKLKTQAFFASFDQCSDKASGYSACSALSAVISHWLRSNPCRTPTREEFDSLIVQGSLEWRNLCEHLSNFQSNTNPNLDIDIVKDAGIGPISISIENSFMGIFNPEKFADLHLFKSFDDIWCEAVSSDEEEERVYIFGSNGHFFVLKSDSQACYIIDTLGARLYEYCNRAYILKFDSASRMEMVRKDMRAVVCEGRECCKEFIKSFYAAHTVREMEEMPNKDIVALLNKLQFDLTYIKA